MYSNNIIISFFLILFLNPTYEQGSGSYEIREHSLSRPYASVFSTSSSHWDLTGNTLVTDRYIRLTPDVQSKAGGLWNVIPVTYPEWEMQVHFKVHGSNKHYSGDGFVIWYVNDIKASGPVFGYKDYFYGLAIVLDTYANTPEEHKPNTYPYISAIVNNGSLHYDHDRDGTNINIDGCHSLIRNQEKDTLIAVRYQNDRLTVSTDIEGNNVWKECFSIGDIHLPTHLYFGFSAATGELSDNHDIISIHTYQLESSEQRRMEDRKSIVPASSSARLQEATVSTIPSNWSALRIFSIVVGLILTCLGGLGIYYYMKNRRRSPRFY